MMEYTFETGERMVEEVRTEVEAAMDGVDDEGWCSTNLGNVQWHPNGSEFYSPWLATAPPGEIVAPQVTQTATEDHDHSGMAHMFRRFDGEYVLVDEFQTLGFSYWAIADYLAANYGTVPHLHHGSYKLFPEDRKLPGSQAVPPGEPTDERHETLYALLRDELEKLPFEEAVSLLDVDEYYHLVATKVPDGVVDDTADRRILEWLDSGDVTERARAVRWIDATAISPQRRRSQTAPAGKQTTSRTPDTVPSVAGIDTLARFIEALPSVDATTQRLVARTLWEPWVFSDESIPTTDHAVALAGLVDAELPEVRVGALYGAGRILGERYVAAEGDGSRAIASLEPAIQAFYDAYVQALADDHPIVRARAADMLVSVLGGEPKDTVIVADEPLLNPISRQTRWAMVRGIARLNDGRTAIAARLVDETVERLFEEVLDGNPEAIEMVVSYGYDRRSPEWTSARKALAETAEEDASVLTDHVEAPLEAVRDGTATPADLSLLNALVPHVPERIADASDALVALLDDSNAVRVEAAWTLLSLRARRPSAVPAERGTLVDVLAEVCNERGRLVPERVRRLASADPDRAASVLVALAERGVGSSGDEVSSYAFSKAIAIVSRTDPSVIAGASRPVCEALTPLASENQPAFVGIASAAAADPASFVDAVDALVGCLVDCVLDSPDSTDDLTREAIATTFVAIGEHDETVLPPPIEPLLSHADDVLDSDELQRLLEEEGIMYSSEREPLAPVEVESIDRAS